MDDRDPWTRLLEPFGIPRDVPVPTLGGKQLWADLFVHAGYRIQQSVVTRHHRLLGPRDVRLWWGSYTACRDAFERIRAQRDVRPLGDHLVILLHGMFRAKDVWGPMAGALRRAGYEAAALNYPSSRRSVEDHAEQVGQVIANAEGVRTVSFVGHSLGGIVARMVLGRPAPWRERVAVNRLVTLGTPNQGAELVDILRSWWSFRALAGPVGTQIGTDRITDIPRPSCPFGTVAGARGDGQGWNPMIPGDDDGVVSLASTSLPGAEDALVVNGVHTFLMRRPDVIEATIRYLGTGRFTA
jgi:pimeloyl-ACP methyl ester carboxylesterase